MPLVTTTDFSAADMRLLLSAKIIPELWRRGKAVSQVKNYDELL
jgi:hypothetical protein